MAYFIAFNASNEVIGSGYNPNPTDKVSNIEPTFSEEVFNDFASFKTRFEELGFVAMFDPNFPIEPLEP